jgi:hypothetical protein
MSIEAAAVWPDEPTANTEWESSVVPVGIVTEMGPAPAPGTVAGDPVSSGPIGLSSRKVSVSPAVKPEIDPANVAGSTVMGALGSVRVAEPTDIGALGEPSGPVHEPRRACTEYRHVPAGTDASMQLVEATAPEQAAPIS